MGLSSRAILEVENKAARDEGATKARLETAKVDCRMACMVVLKCIVLSVQGVIRYA